MKFKVISIIKNLLRYTSKVLLRNQKSMEDFKKSCKADKILIISLTHLGDIVLLSPFLRNLRMNFPKAQIDILLKEQVSGILEYCPHINNRIIYNAKWVTSKKKGEKKEGSSIKTLTLIRQLLKNRYALSFVTHPHIFSNMIPWLARIPFRVGYSEGGDKFLNISAEKERRVQHARDYSLNLLRCLNLTVESENLEIFLDSQDINFAEGFLRGLSLSDNTFLIGVHPGSGSRKKNWFPERYAKVIQYLINKYDTYILLFAGKQEADITEKIKINLLDYQHRILDLTGKTTVRQMAGLMARCKVILANDAGPMHIATALNKPTVALFIATSDYGPQVWGPLSKNSRVVSSTNGKVNRPEDIKAEDVIKALDELISK